MSVVGSDTFTGTDGTDISGRTPVVGGTWTQCSSLTTNFVEISDANRIRLGGTAGTGRRGYYINTSPSSNEYDVQVDDYVLSNNLRVLGPAGRLSAAGSAGYAVSYVNSSGEWTLYRITGVSSSTVLATYAQSLSVSTTYVVKLEIRTAAKKVYIDGVERISSADDTTTGTGFGGVWSLRTEAGNNTQGHQLDNFKINDLASIGTLSATLDATTISATATSTSSGATGSLTATLGATTISATATFVAAPSTGTLSATLANTTISATATSVAPAGATGSLAITLGATTISATATYAASYTGPTWFKVTVVNPSVEPAKSMVVNPQVDPNRSRVVNS